MIKVVSIFLFTLVFSGCVSTNPYGQFFQPNGGKLPDDLNPNKISDVNIVTAPIDEIKFEQKAHKLFGKFLFLGESNFIAESSKIGNEQALAYAKKIGATHIIIARQFNDNVSGDFQLTTPTQETTYHSGTIGNRSFSGNVDGVSFSGNVDGYNYSGTSTTYGSKTTNIPYNFKRYRVRAKFYNNYNTQITMPSVSASTEKWMRARGYIKN
jgi:hypothetical protein